MHNLFLEAGTLPITASAIIRELFLRPDLWKQMAVLLPRRKISLFVVTKVAGHHSLQPMERQTCQSSAGGLWRHASSASNLWDCWLTKKAWHGRSSPVDKFYFRSALTLLTVILLQRLLFLFDNPASPPNIYLLHAFLLTTHHSFSLSAAAAMQNVWDAGGSVSWRGKNKNKNITAYHNPTCVPGRHRPSFPPPLLKHSHRWQWT